MEQHESLECTLYPRPERRGFTVGLINLALTFEFKQINLTPGYRLTGVKLWLMNFQ
jgi:hypothetical protein